MPPTRTSDANHIQIIAARKQVSIRGCRLHRLGYLCTAIEACKRASIHCPMPGSQVPPRLPRLRGSDLDSSVDNERVNAMSS